MTTTTRPAHRRNLGDRCHIDITCTTPPTQTVLPHVFEQADGSLRHEACSACDTHAQEHADDTRVGVYLRGGGHRWRNTQPRHRADVAAVQRDRQAAARLLAAVDAFHSERVA